MDARASSVPDPVAVLRMRPSSHPALQPAGSLSDQCSRSRRWWPTSETNRPIARNHPCAARRPIAAAARGVRAGRRSEGGYPEPVGCRSLPERRHQPGTQPGQVCREATSTLMQRANSSGRGTLHAVMVSVGTGRRIPLILAPARRTALQPQIAVIRSWTCPRIRRRAALPRIALCF